MQSATAKPGDLVGERARDERAEGLAGVAGHRGRQVLRRLLHHRSAVIGFVIIAGLIVTALAAPLLAPDDPIALSRTVLKPPSRHHLLGTDNLGRDILSRVVYGTRISLQMGFIAVAIAAAIGTAIGVVAGSYGGWTDSVLMRLVDALMAVPGILLALTVAAMLGSGLHNAMIAVGVAWIPSFARIVRASVLQVKAMPYVDAARSLGCGDFRLIWRHILPNALTPVIVLTSLGVGTAILIGAALSFLGVGARPPTAEWGIMLADGRRFMRQAWWIMTFPGVAISVSVLAANLLGDGLRDVLDPRMKV